MLPRFIFVEFWPVCALAALRLPGNSPQILWPTFESRGADGTRTYLGEFRGFGNLPKTRGLDLVFRCALVAAIGLLP